MKSIEKKVNNHGIKNTIADKNRTKLLITIITMRSKHRLPKTCESEEKEARGTGVKYLIKPDNSLAVRSRVFASTFAQLRHTLLSQTLAFASPLLTLSQPWIKPDGRNLWEVYDNKFLLPVFVQLQSGFQFCISLAMYSDWVRVWRDTPVCFECQFVQSRYNKAGPINILSV